ASRCGYCNFSTTRVPSARVARSVSEADASGNASPISSCQRSATWSRRSGSDATQARPEGLLPISSTPSGNGCGIRPLMRRRPAEVGAERNSSNLIPLTKPLDLTLGPFGLEVQVACAAPVDDRFPRRDCLVEPVFVLEQEGGAVQRADVLRLELKRAPPVGQRRLDLAEALLRLAAQRHERRVVRRESKPRLGDRQGLLERVRVQTRGREEAMLANLTRGVCEPLLVRLHRGLLLLQGRSRHDQLVVRLVVVRVERDRPLV